jgi:Transposase DDE domain
MSRNAEVIEELEDWEVLCSFLPEGWEQKAREHGALSRARGVAGAPALLRILLIHIATGCSLAETSVRAGQIGLGRLNASAVYKRLRSAEEWLRWLAEQMRCDLGMATPAVGRRVRAVDATAVSEPGSTGTDWRIHYAINLKSLQCDYFELTDVHGGEMWRRFPVLPGDIMLGDRGYANPKGVEHVVGARGDVVVRLNRSALPLWDSRGKALLVLKSARALSPKQTGEWAAWVQRESSPAIAGRLIIVRKSRQAAAHARQQLQQVASRKQKPVSTESLEAAQYFFLWTSLTSTWSRFQVLELYRSRWQIELAFKRMKSIMGLGHLPKKDPESCRAWLHGKLFTSLLVERLIGAAQTLSPWGYELGGAPEPMA